MQQPPMSGRARRTEGAQPDDRSAQRAAHARPSSGPVAPTARWRSAVVALVMGAAGVLAVAAPAHASGGVDGVIVRESAPSLTEEHATFSRANGQADEVRSGEHGMWAWFANFTWPWGAFYSPEIGREVLVDVLPLDGGSPVGPLPDGAMRWRGDEFSVDLPALMAAMGTDVNHPPEGFRLVVRLPPGAPRPIFIEAEVLLNVNGNGQGTAYPFDWTPDHTYVHHYDAPAVRGSAGSTVVVGQAPERVGRPLFAGSSLGQVTATWTGGGRTVPATIRAASGASDGRAVVTLPAGVQGPGVLELRDVRREFVTHVVRVPVLPPLPDPVEAYVTDVYKDLFGRVPDGGGLAAWSRALRTGTPYGAVADGITYSSEFRSRLVDRAYADYLGRSPDVYGREHWVGQMHRGVHITELEAGFVASDEYFYRNGFSNESWVRAMYRDVLGRSASSTEVASWAGVTPRQGRKAVAAGFLRSTEHLTTVVEGHYQRLLHRSIDPSGAQTWVRAIQAGHREEEIVASIVASAEYRGNVPRP